MRTLKLGRPRVFPLAAIFAAFVCALALIANATGVSAASPPAVTIEREAAFDASEASMWQTDRHDPSSWTGGTSAEGRSDVLTVEISATTDTQQDGSVFYRTEGKKKALDPTTSVETSLYLDPAWQGTAVRAGVWAQAVFADNPGSDDGWGILEFSTASGYVADDPAGVTENVMFRAWDSEDGWTELPDVAVPWGSWVTLGVEMDLAAQQWHYYVDGTLVVTLDWPTGAEYAHISGVILNHYNYGAELDGGLARNPYTVLWQGPSVEQLFASIQDAIAAASDGETIQVSSGTYEESIVLDKPLTLQGAGDDVSTGTILDVTGGGTGITVSADEVTISNIRVDKGDALDADDGKGIEATGAAVNDLTLAGVTVTGATNGFRVGSGTTIDGFTVSDSHFDGNDIGWYLAKETSASAAATVTDVSVTNTSFNDNLRKGIYAEKLDNAVFDGITVNNSGVADDYGFNAGIDINLKWSAYSNIEIRNSTVSGSGLMGSATLFDPVGLTLKARDDGSYGSPAATLSGVTISNVTVSGGVVGIRFGEPDKDNAGPTGVVVSDSSLSGTGGVALDNQTQAAVTATSNWWGSASGPTSGQVLGDVDVSDHCVQSDCGTPPPPPPPPVDNGNDDPPPTFTPTPSPTVEEDGGVEVEVEAQEEVEVPADAPVEVKVTSSSGGSAQVNAPAGALPQGSKLTVSSVADPVKLVEQAPPPASAQLTLAFSVKAETASGEAIEDDFDAPVQLEFEVPASAAPEGVTTSEMVVAFWNGTEWVEVDAVVTVNEDGSLSITAETTHFTLFAVFHQEGRGTFSGPLFDGVTLTVWRGGPIPLLSEAAPDATSFWVLQEGNFFSYVPSGPDWVNAPFLSLFPNGRIAANTALIVVR